MIEAGGGAIVNVCSISAHIAQPGYLTYNASKGAVAAMTRCIAMDLSPHNIRVNSVSPGTVWTQSNQRYLARTRGLDRAGADKAPDIGGAHMLKRCADPEEIADAIMFLASDNASFITAEDLFVDGGLTKQ
jgi:dihydroanticapsin dehydrogenase